MSEDAAVTLADTKEARRSLITGFNGRRPLRSHSVLTPRRYSRSFFLASFASFKARSRIA